MNNEAKESGIFLSFIMFFIYFLFSFFFILTDARTFKIKAFTFFVLMEDQLILCNCQSKNDFLGWGRGVCGTLIRTTTPATST